MNSPQSLSRPHPRIVIGGSGEQKTLRLVARYADACNLFPTPEIPHKLEVLRAHCEAEGRDYAAIEKTSMYRWEPDADYTNFEPVIEALRWLASMGIQSTFIGPLQPLRPETPRGHRQRIMPAVADL